jgi:hypothetical protein
MKNNLSDLIMALPINFPFVGIFIFPEPINEPPPIPAS